MSSERRKVKFGYGIVDKDGKPYWDEACVCQDRQILEAEILPNLNDPYGPSVPEIDSRQPFRVVTLWRVSHEQ
jgi:hypothetical protein